MFKCCIMWEKPKKKVFVRITMHKCISLCSIICFLPPGVQVGRGSCRARAGQIRTNTGGLMPQQPAARSDKAFGRSWWQGLRTWWVDLQPAAGIHGCSGDQQPAAGIDGCRWSRSFPSGRTTCGYVQYEQNKAALRESSTVSRKFLPAFVRGQGGPARAHGCGTTTSNSSRIHFSPHFNKQMQFMQTGWYS